MWKTSTRSIIIIIINFKEGMWTRSNELYNYIYLSLCSCYRLSQQRMRMPRYETIYETTCQVRERSPGKHMCRKKKLCKSQFHADSRRHLFKRVDVGITSYIPLIIYYWTFHISQRNSEHFMDLTLWGKSRSIIVCYF